MSGGCLCAACGESQRRAAAQRCGVRVSAAMAGGGGPEGKHGSSALGLDVGWPLGSSDKCTLSTESTLHETQTSRTACRPSPKQLGNMDWASHAKSFQGIIRYAADPAASSWKTLLDLFILEDGKPY